MRVRNLKRFASSWEKVIKWYLGGFCNLCVESHRNSNSIDLFSFKFVQTPTHVTLLINVQQSFLHLPITHHHHPPSSLLLLPPSSTMIQWQTGVKGWRLSSKVHVISQLTYFSFVQTAHSVTSWYVSHPLYCIWPYSPHNKLVCGLSCVHIHHHICCPAPSSVKAVDHGSTSQSWNSMRGKKMVHNPSLTAADC